MSFFALTYSIDLVSGIHTGRSVLRWLSAGSPVKNVIGDWLLWESRTEWLSIILTIRITEIHSDDFRRNSDSRKRHALIASLKTVSIVPLELGLAGVGEWWLSCKESFNPFITSFLKCETRSDTLVRTTPNDAKHVKSTSWCISCL